MSSQLRMRFYHLEEMEEGRETALREKRNGDEILFGISVRLPAAGIILDLLMQFP